MRNAAIEHVDPTLTDEGVEGNRRLTASNGALIFVLLAAEGVTVLSVRSLFRAHVLIGIILIPPVVLKVATTGYRAARYYLSEPRYRARGAPPPLLRLLGPFVVTLSVVVLASGVVLLWLGPTARTPWFQIHKASFILWFGVMAVHVLGHILETVRVAPLDWSRSGSRHRGAAVRKVVVVLALLAGVGLGLLAQSRVTDWQAKQDLRSTTGPDDDAARS